MSFLISFLFLLVALETPCSSRHIFPHAASSHLENAQRLSVALPRTTAVSVDVNEPSSLDALVSKHDIVISLIPYTYHAQVIRSACRFRKHVVTTSYVSDAIRELAPEIEKAGITVMNEIGLDPGIDHLYAVKAIDEVHAEGGKVRKGFEFLGSGAAHIYPCVKRYSHLLFDALSSESLDQVLPFLLRWSSRS